MRHPTLIPYLALLVTASVACGPQDLLPAPEGITDERTTASGGKADLLTDGPAFAGLPDGAVFDRPLEVLFPPDDPVVTLELKLIDEVIQARKADQTSPTAEGQNPYRIRYAVYNLRNASIIQRLGDAEAEGVDVQVLTESDQLAPDRTWNQADEILVARGFELVLDHRQLTPQTCVSADLIGVKDSGLMHLKTRIFETPAGRRVLSGSMNPGDNAVANEETLHLINDPTLTARYAMAYDAVLHDQNIPNVWDDTAAVNVLFTPVSTGPRAATHLLQWLEAEQEQILLMVFSLREVSAPGVNRSLTQILADKAAAGVPVYMITDRMQSDGVDNDGNPLYYNDKTEDRLRAAGVHVYEATNRNTPFTAMHHKVAVLGRTNIRVITDAANWTRAALGNSTKRADNVESVLFIDSSRLDGNRTGRRYLAQWVRVLERYAHQSLADGEAPAAQVIGTLMALPGWPGQAVTFTAHDAHTSWGETVRVRGDHAALGQWGALHPGIALATFASTYPTWTGGSAVVLPLGTPFEWKLTASAASGPARWEAGPNRQHRAAPLPLIPTDPLMLHGTWRP